MASGRIIKKQISISEQVNDITLKSAFLFNWMILHADDFGRLAGNPRKIKALVVPMRLDISVDDIEFSLQEMAKVGLIKYYLINDEHYVQLITFDRHQSGLHKRTKSKLPSPEEETDFKGSRKFREVPGNSPTRVERKRREEKRREYDLALHDLNHQVPTVFIDPKTAAPRCAQKNNFPSALPEAPPQEPSPLCILKTSSSDFYEEFESRGFSIDQILHPKTRIMFSRWEKEKVSRDDICKALDYVHSKLKEKPTSLRYYEKIVLEFCEARLNPTVEKIKEQKDGKFNRYPRTPTKTEMFYTSCFDGLEQSFNSVDNKNPPKD